MRGVPRMDIWAHKDAFEDLQKHLNAADVAQLRAVCRDWRGVVDSTLSRLVPVNLDCPLLASRALPGLKSLLLTQLQYLEPQQLHHCSVLSQLTQLHIGGPACSRLKTHHLAWVGKLTNLQELSVTKCSKVKLSILSCWHSLTNLQAVSLIGLSANLRTTSPSPSSNGNSHSSNSSTSSSSNNNNNNNNNNSSSSSSVLHAFLSAGVASSLTSLVLGDHQGLSFLSDSALEVLGQLLGPVGRLRVLDLSGCIELTDAGIQQLSGLTSLEQLSLHNCMKISTGATQTLTTITALRTLNLRGCSQLTDAQLLPALNTLTQLESLNLQGCSGLIGTCISPHICKGLVHLRILNLSYCQGLGIGVFHGLVEFCELRDLDMTGCNVVSGWEALQWLGKLKQLVRLQGSYWRCKAVGHPAAAGTAAAAAALLLPPNLKHLDLSHLTCSDSFLQTLTSHFPKTLTYLNLSNCSGIGPASSTDCLDSLSRLGNLETLMLSSSVGGIPGHVLQCLNGLTGLRDLQLEFVHDTAAMTSDMLAAVGDSNGSSTTAWLDHLMACNSSSSSGSVRKVGGSSSFSRPAAAAGAGYVAANRACLYKQPVAAGPATGVAQLLAGTTGTSITDCFSKDGSSSSGSSSSSSSSSSSRTMLNQTAQRELFPAAPKLAQDSEPVVKEQQQSWLLDLQRLQNLSVTFSPWVTDQILEDLSGLTGLTSLNLVACQNLTGSGFQSWIPHHRHSSSSSSSSGSSCCDEAAAVCCSSGCAFCSTGGPNLMSLKLTGCASLTDDGLAAAAAACPLLEELLLPGCRGLTDQGVKQLSNLSRLQTLSLASNKNIMAGSLHVLVPNLQHLRTLALSLCGGICDAALESLAFATDLRSLDLRGCWQITDDGVFDLLCRSFSLMQLNVDSCHRLGNRCWPETFRPGDPLLPFTDVISSSRPGLLIRVAAAASGATNTLSSSKRTDCNLSSGDEDEKFLDGTATSGSECTTA